MPKPELPTSKEDKARAYLNILFELKARFELIRQNRASDSPFGMAREACFLHLRHICELIAIGCLVVQGDYTSSREFIDEYRPNKIFRALEKYEGFFPQPNTITRDDDGMHIAFNNVADAMTRKEVERLWGITGNYLHRLTIGSFFRTEANPPNRWDEIDSYIAKLTALLNSHGIPMHNPKTMVLASLGLPDGKPALSFLEYLDGGGMNVQSFDGAGETPYWRSANS